MKTAYVLLAILITATQVSAQSRLPDSTYQKILKLQDSVLLFNGKLKLINVYKQQLITIYENQGKDDATLQTALIRHTFKPYESLWTSYVGDSLVYAEQVLMPLIQNSMLMLNQQGLDFANSNLDEYFKSTATGMKKLSGLNARGVWYIAFGSGVTDLGGFGDGRMVLDLAHEKITTAYVKLILPHEINHQIYDLSASIDTTARGLYRCINEGFAVYMNQKLFGDQYSLATYLQYPENELKFCFDNDSMIFTKLNRFLFTSDPDHPLALSDRGTKIFPGGPGALGYYLGYRICESYVKLHGEKSWKAIYTLPVKAVYNGSRYGQGRSPK